MYRLCPAIIFALIMISGCAKEEGCTDISACNYSFAAEIDDDTCFYLGDNCDDGDINTLNDVVDSNCNCQGQLAFGCTDSTACNFSPDATVDVGSCFFEGQPCDDGEQATVDDMIINCECVGEPAAFGCTESQACNYSFLATADNGSCLYPGDPCNDGDINTTNDTYNANCVCAGEESFCEIDNEGYVSMIYGVYADGAANECVYQIYLVSDPSIGTEATTGETNFDWNTSSLDIAGFGPWVMSVADAAGNGKGGTPNDAYNGGYGAYCYNSNQELIEVFYTPFTEGGSSTTEFTLDVFGVQGEMSIEN